jgi:hypothetical protein
MNAGDPWPVWTPDNENAIITAVEQQTWRSSSDIAHKLGLSQPRVLEVLYDIQFHPYHYLRSTHLFPDSCPLQIQLCKWLRYKHTADDLFLHNILWPDKACIMREAILNFHDSHL